MLWMSLAASGNSQVKIIRFAATLALIIAATACTAGGSLSPKASGPSLATSLTNAAPQVPLLYVVDGVKYPRDQVPSLTRDQIAAVQVIKGHAALKRYGPDASYGVVVIRTRQTAVAPRS
jgi:lipopolysaccharide export LptBFGC system permease protein LptF